MWVKLIDEIKITSNHQEINISGDYIKYLQIDGRKHRTINFTAEVETKKGRLPDGTVFTPFDNFAYNGYDVRILIEGRMKFRKQPDGFSIPSVAYDYPKVEILHPVHQIPVWMASRATGMFYSGLKVLVAPNFEVCRQIGRTDSLLKSLRDGDVLIATSTDHARNLRDRLEAINPRAFVLSTDNLLHLVKSSKSSKTTEVSLDSVGYPLATLSVNDILDWANRSGFVLNNDFGDIPLDHRYHYQLNNLKEF